MATVLGGIIAAFIEPLVWLSIFIGLIAYRRTRLVIGFALIWAVFISLFANYHINKAGSSVDFGTLVLLIYIPRIVWCVLIAFLTSRIRRKIVARKLARQAGSSRRMDV